MSDNNNFWNDFRNRSIYGDAAGPPKNATEHAADGLAKFGRTAQGGGAGSGGYIDIDINFRYSWRRIAVFLGIAAASYGGDKLVTTDFTSLSFLQWLFTPVALIAGIIGGWQLFANLFNIMVCRGIGAFKSRALRFALLGAAGGYFLFAFLDRKFFWTGYADDAGIVVGLLAGFLLGKRKKDTVQ
ncbi:MAG TPA: hypothetical protein PLX33_11955 [Alphaproteobacteria bacterium]|nr:hypothetical protein [Alphaproteobacteria bacterium]